KKIKKDDKVRKSFFVTSEKGEVKEEYICDDRHDNVEIDPSDCPPLEVIGNIEWTNSNVCDNNDDKNDEKQEMSEHGDSLENGNEENTSEAIERTKKTRSEELKEEVYSYDPKKLFDDWTKKIENEDFVDPLKEFPRLRISKIIKLDPYVNKVNVECLGLFALAVKLFVEDLSRRAYKFTVQDGRKILHLQDICRAVESDSMFDFLIDIIPRLPRSSKSDFST
ncbi:nuclear Y/CCAAT-box binding factor C subunit NF/YC, partial [Reticulomyxa filosa]